MTVGYIELYQEIMNEMKIQKEQNGVAKKSIVSKNCLKKIADRV